MIGPKIMITIVVFAIAIVFSCRKNTDDGAAIIEQANKPGVRELIISALNPGIQDTLAGFNLSITMPNRKLDTMVTGKRLVIKNLVAGKYNGCVTKTGYICDSISVVVVLPSKSNVSLFLSQTALLPKAANPVVVSTSVGSSIPVSTSADVPSSPVVATVTVPAGIVVTMPDGSKPTTISLSATNLPTENQITPVNMVNGVPTVEAQPLGVSNGQIVLKTIDLQPEGITFNIPMIVELNISDMYPASMDATFKAARQNALTLNYIRKDGTIEKISPDHFSADRGIAYFKITHFSEWNLVNSNLTMTKVTTGFAAEKNVISDCGKGLTGSFTNTIHYPYGTGSDPYLPWLITSIAADVNYTVTANYDIPPVSGKQVTAHWSCIIETWELKDSTPGGVPKRTLLIPAAGSSVTATYADCHNQGG